MIDLNVLAGWMMSILVSLSPLNMKTYNPNDAETPVEKKERLESIAHDIVDVTFDENEKPLFQGPNGRYKSAVLMATWASHESGAYRKSVDTGSNRGDRGGSWCIMQLHIGEKGKTTEGWTGKDLVTDRKKCILAGYHVMRSSINTCKNVPESEAMAAYASGNCEIGLNISRNRYKHMTSVLLAHPFQKYLDNTTGVKTDSKTTK